MYALKVHFVILGRIIMRREGSSLTAFCLPKQTE